MSKETQNYEVTFILGEKATKEDAQSKAAELKASIEKLGGQVTQEELWGRRELAYEIKRNRSGFYATLWFTAPTSAVKPLEQQMNFDETVIRSLVTKAYVEAQPGNLAPVAEEEKQDRRSGRGQQQEEKASAEEMLRRSSASPAKKQEAAPAEAEQAIPEEERLKKLDETLEELLKDEA